MVRKKDPYPTEGDLVISTISKVSGHGAFARLDEYEGKDGFIHISEVASIWVKNIRDYVREGQKTVAKVLSVDRARGHIDLSVRRVGDTQRTNKTQEWKREQKAEKLLERAAAEIGKTVDDAYKDVGFILEERYGEVYTGLEEIIIEGKSALEGVPEEWIEPVVKVAGENIVLPTVEIEGFVELQIKSGDGVLKIKEALKEAQSVTTDQDVKLEISYLSPPRYRVHVTAPDYKSAEDVIRQSAEKAVEYIIAHGGEGRFIRDAK
ncbi:MAG TPA: translation initiation factor IF-2 subunit alpha [Euryarchaeota archaeon]|nr:general stress protein 13 [archaeon BMS3Abin16]HDH27815.1 translation initiation factor IF-2 subunit alpha [Euryarchaeota archaeon]